MGRPAPPCLNAQSGGSGGRSCVRSAVCFQRSAAGFRVRRQHQERHRQQGPRGRRRRTIRDSRCSTPGRQCCTQNRSAEKPDEGTSDPARPSVTALQDAGWVPMTGLPDGTELKKLVPGDLAIQRKNSRAAIDGPNVADGTAGQRRGALAILVAGERNVPA